MQKQLTRKAIRVVGPSIAYIPLTKGYFSLIDEDMVDFLEVIAWSTSVKTNGYVRVIGNVRDPQLGRVKLAMHRMVLVKSNRIECDHVNRNPLDNRACNLRQASRAQNARNIGLTKANRSGFKGVHWSKSLRKWVSQIRINGETHHLGCFL